MTKFAFGLTDSEASKIDFSTPLHSGRNDDCSQRLEKIYSRENELEKSVILDEMKNL